MSLLQKFFGTKQDRDIKELYPLVSAINALEPQMQKLSDQELQAQTPKLKQRLQEGSTLNDILPEAFATVREASVRVLGMRPFDVQLMGGIVLHRGIIAEMKTGEGKTLTATMPVYLNALTGKGTHLVTVNDYLAERDAHDMGQLYNWLGLTTGAILSNMDDDDRRQAYLSDVTYGTNNEFAFDYLRDNMKFNLEDYVQRDHHFCIVDEVDSILIDEARTPLLISGPSEGNTDLYYSVNKIIPTLKQDEHFTVDEKSRSAVFTDAGIVQVQEMLSIENLFEMRNIEVLHHLNQALKAYTLFHKDVDYVVRDGKVIIVDEFTGRLKEGSRWSDGLHQSVEAKENVSIKSENQTLASITFQNYFKLYEKLAGMTGTADTEAEEFRKIYNLGVIVIPTNLPMVRDDQPDIIYASKKAKYQAIGEMINKLHHKGQPVLVGTISIESSEELAAYLKQKKVPHEILNAKQHEREAQIIANAGESGSVTIATNMAGRGTDIKLSEATKKAGGLCIIGTERHESRRIDNQLRGRSGRQGDPGLSKFFLSLEDDLMRVFGSDKIKGIMTRFGMNDEEPIEHKMISNAIAKAQKRVEAHNFDIRKHLLDYDNVMNEQRKVIYQIRKEILNDDGNHELVQEFLQEVMDDFVANYRPADAKKAISALDWPWEEIHQGFKTTFHHESNLTGDECFKKFNGEATTYLMEKAQEFLKNKLAEYDQKIVDNTLREVLLSTFDSHWKDHLLSMDHLKEGINLRSYGQKDPLVEYKREAFDLYEAMKFAIKKSVIDTLFSVKLYTQAEIDEIKRQQQAYLEAQMKAHQEAQNRKQNSGSPVTRSEKKVGRNEPCPCGSGKKYKQCHGR